MLYLFIIGEIISYPFHFIHNINALNVTFLGNLGGRCQVQVESAC